MGKPVRKEKKLLLSILIPSNLQELKMKAGCFLSSQSGKTFWFVKADLIDLHGTHSCLASVLKGKPSEDGDSSREGFGSRGEPLKSLSLK